MNQGGTVDNWSPAGGWVIELAQKQEKEVLSHLFIEAWRPQ